MRVLACATRSAPHLPWKGMCCRGGGGGLAGAGWMAWPTNVACVVLKPSKGTGARGGGE